jgi:CheY-like chemotaxis protein
MDGYEATRHLRGAGYTDLGIGGLSANAMKHDYQNAFAEGMNDYVAKPVELAAMIEVISTYLDRV